MSWGMQLVDLVQVALLLGLVIQIAFALFDFRVSHIRQRRQSTIEYLNQISERHRAHLKLLDDSYGRLRPLPEKNLTPETVLHIRGFLTEIERFSVGVNMGIFDFEVAKRCNSSMLRTNFYRLEPYILGVRRDRNSDGFYAEYQQLVKQLENSK